jgi:hypothetical protein
VVTWNLRHPTPFRIEVCKRSPEPPPKKRRGGSAGEGGGFALVPGTAASDGPSLRGVRRRRFMPGRIGGAGHQRPRGESQGEAVETASAGIRLWAVHKRGRPMTRLRIGQTCRKVRSSLTWAGTCVPPSPLNRLLNSADGAGRPRKNGHPPPGTIGNSRFGFAFCPDRHYNE